MNANSTHSAPGGHARVNNAAVADMLRQLAATLRIQGEDRFKTKAYLRAAETIEALPQSLQQFIAAGHDLKELPGVGKAISGSITEILHTGVLGLLSRASTALPAELAELAANPRVDSKLVLNAYKTLGINSLAELRRLLDSGEVRERLGSRKEFQLRHGLCERPRMLLWAAEKIVRQIEPFLRSIPDVTKVSTVGSLRRRQDTVGDLNFLVAGSDKAKVFKGFAKFGAVQEVERTGASEARFKLSSGISVNLTWCQKDRWGLELLLRTGSTSHLDTLRDTAATRGISLTATAMRKRRIDLSSEAALYSSLRLPFIEPELREGRGEVAAATKDELPELVSVDELRGDLHMHTTASDGANTLEEMAAAAEERGYEYIAITDHSQALKITNGLTEKRLFQQLRAIDKLNARCKKLVVLKSAEVDILEDGRLDYSDAALRQLDFTICSIHSRFALGKEQQTVRILRAMDNRYFNILGHATGRLLLRREGYDFDVERIFRHARENGCFFEINSSPDRLDLSDEHAMRAKELGVKIAINTDAHSTKELNFITAGVHQARRGWLSAGDVLNTMSVKDLLETLARK